MSDRFKRWSSATDEELAAELARYVQEASQPTCSARLFWKIGAEFKFGGCNTQFAKDAGFSSAEELVGLNDFDQRMPWRPQAAKYRQDDEAVVANRTAHLDIIERQKSPTGDISWVRVGKVPIQRADDSVIGVLGMYEMIDAAKAHSMVAERLRNAAPKPK